MLSSPREKEITTYEASWLLSRGTCVMGAELGRVI